MVTGGVTKRIMFITPPYHAGVVESAGRWMPLGFVYLAGAARKAGWEAVIYDAMTKQHDLEEVESVLRSSDAGVIAVSSITSTMPAALDVLRCAKRLRPDVVTILGGVHPTFCADDLLAEAASPIDCIVRGEGEETLTELLEALSAGSALTDIRGISFRQDGKVVSTGHRPFLRSLDNLPAAWDLVSWSDYQYYVIPGSRLAAVSTSRGCTFGCTFCSQQKFWKQVWRSRQPAGIVEELAMLKKHYGANVFLLVDEYPTKDRDRWEELIDRIIAERLDIYLLMETRVEDIVRDRAILPKYRQAGIVHVYVGVEATSQETLDSVKKDISVEQSFEAIQLLREHRMISETSFVLGFPWETKETIERTLELAQHYNPDFAHFLAITPWPYADFYDEVKNSIEITDFAKYNLVEPIIRPDAMTLKEVRHAMVDCYRRYYMRKAPEYYTESDPFKRDYLKRSMHLIMRNSFLTNLMKEEGFSLVMGSSHRQPDEVRSPAA